MLLTSLAEYKTRPKRTPFPPRKAPGWDLFAVPYALKEAFFKIYNLLRLKKYIEVMPIPFYSFSNTLTVFTNMFYALNIWISHRFLPVLLPGFQGTGGFLL